MRCDSTLLKKHTAIPPGAARVAHMAHLCQCCEGTHGMWWKVGITKWRIQWWSEWNAFILPALSARSLVCHALLDNAAVGTDPITRLSPFALAKLARPQGLHPTTMPSDNYIFFLWVQWSVLHSAVSKCLKGHSHLARIKLPTVHGWQSAVPHASTMWNYGWAEKQTIPRHRWIFYDALSHRLVQNDLQFHSLLTWFLLGCCQSFLQTKVLPKKIAKSGQLLEKHFLPEQWWLLPACSHQIQPQLISVSRTAGWWVVLKNASWAQDMSMVLGAFARMRYRDRDMMVRIAESTPAILGQFDSHRYYATCCKCRQKQCVFTAFFFNHFF